MASNGFTPTEQRILDVLSDGKSHIRAELLRCLDDLSIESSVRPHLMRLRAKLRLRGETIVRVWVQRRCEYQHVRLVGVAAYVIPATDSVAQEA